MDSSQYGAKSGARTLWGKRSGDAGKRTESNAWGREGSTSGRCEVERKSAREIPKVRASAKNAKNQRPEPRLSSSLIKPKERQVASVPKAHVWKENRTGNNDLFSNRASNFRNFYDRGDLPICISHGAKRSLTWKTDIEVLDLQHYLPMFFQGLRETQEPYSFIAFHGVQNLLAAGGNRILPVLPQLIQPMKMALDTKNKTVISRVLQVLQSLAKIAYVGEALVPYYRNLLPTLNMVMTLEKKKNLGGAIDYGQRKKENLYDLTAETLAVLEKHGGPSAYVNIKYMIPSYEKATIL